MEERNNLNIISNLNIYIVIFHYYFASKNVIPRYSDFHYKLYFNGKNVSEGTLTVDENYGRGRFIFFITF